MMGQREGRLNRRELLGRLAVAGTTGLLALKGGRFVADVFGTNSGVAAAEAPPETTRLRLLRFRSICQAPQFLAQEFLRAEGFDDVQYIKIPGAKAIPPALVSGEADISMHFAAPLLLRLDAGDPIVLLAGAQVGCFELFGNDRVRAIRDLKGKTVAVPELGVGPHTYISIMAAYVGLDPGKDIKWVAHPPAESMRLLAEGKVDAYMGFPPDPQELRAKKVGHVVVNSAVDRPWSQYFCCLVAANREFVRRHPIATKRALRAILKGADVCAGEPERVARFLVDKGYTERYDYALDALKMIPFAAWRTDDPEDTMRFYTVRLHEAGMIKSSPQKIIAQGTNWRFLQELKKEMK